MSETKWTPGPWKVFKPDAARPGIEARRGSIVIWGAAEEEAGIEGLANAHLIAAAPDLYAAGLKVKCFLVARFGRLNDAEARGVLNVLLAALARARGEE